MRHLKPERFKVGDRVYFPSLTDTIVTLKKGKSQFPTYPLYAPMGHVNNMITHVSEAGCALSEINLHNNEVLAPVIFHATVDNMEMLEEVFSLDLEMPEQYVIVHHKGKNYTVPADVIEQFSHDL